MRFVPQLFAFTDEDGWHAGIGDPTFLGWITVLAYFVTAWLAWRAFKTVRTGTRKQRIFWALLCLLLVLLGINKQLDLQTWLTLTVRRFAISEGWYERRRAVQLFFILMVAVFGFFSFRWMWSLLQEKTGPLRLSLAGLFFLVVFVVIRAASFHHIDQFLKYDLGGFRMNWLFELGGVTLIGWGAWLSRRHRCPPGENYSLGRGKAAPLNS
jgi:hypothetical protein